MVCLFKSDLNRFFWQRFSYLAHAWRLSRTRCRFPQLWSILALAHLLLDTLCQPEVSLKHRDQVTRWTLSDFILSPCSMTNTTPRCRWQLVLWKTTLASRVWLADVAGAQDVVSCRKWFSFFFCRSLYLIWSSLKVSNRCDNSRDHTKTQTKGDTNNVCYNIHICSSQLTHQQDRAALLCLSFHVTLIPGISFVKRMSFYSAPVISTKITSLPGWHFGVQSARLEINRWMATAQSPHRTHTRLSVKLMPCDYNNEYCLRHLIFVHDLHV